MSTPAPERPDDFEPAPPPAPEPELAGTHVGEYRVEERVGSGAFGTVYRGVHPLIGKAVAIKVLSRRFSADPEMVSRFVAEARAVNQIRHRHIIDIFSFGQLEDGRHYYIMEYLEGETLQALLDREQRIAPARCVAILRAIGRALDAAHAKGIAHRDLKAENVFLGTDPDGGVWPKLLDFGIAKLTSSDDGLAHKTRSGISIGTPRYMSPEQCHGRQVDHRTDIYAFGVLLYLMLTGVFPFDGDSYMEILMQQVGAAPPPPSAHAPALPEAIDDVVLWLLHKDPAQRPPDLRTAVIVFEQAAERAGLLDADPHAGWQATSARLTTQPAPVVAPPRAGAPRAAVGPRASSGAVPVQPGGRRAPIMAAASLLAIAAIVATVVAQYPRADEPPAAAPTTATATTAAATTAAPSTAAMGQGTDPPATPVGTPAPAPPVVRPDRPGPAAHGPLPSSGSPPSVLPASEAGVALHPRPDGVPERVRPRQSGKPAVRPVRGGPRPSRDDIIDVFGGDAP